MPIDTDIDPGLGLVITVARGLVTGPDVAEHQEALRSRPDFDPDFNHLFDMTGVTELAVQPDQIKTVASVAVFSETSRKAVVADRDVLFGLSRMYEGFRGVPDDVLQVFRDRESALAWLEAG